MKTLLHLAALVSILFLAGCEKEKPVPPPVDPRDRIVGTYSEIGSGFLVATLNGQQSSMPMNIDSPVTISKSGSDHISFTSYIFNKTITGSLTGSRITLDPFTFSYTTSNGMTLNLNVITSLQISGSSITCSYSFTGAIYMNGNSAPVNGSITTILSKQ